MFGDYYYVLLGFKFDIYSEDYGQSYLQNWSFARCGICCYYQNAFIHVEDILDRVLIGWDSIREGPVTEALLVSSRC